MVRDAEQTKQRLLEAAVEEFSRHGVAGARVDRIAVQAGCNKALIYSYFGSKEQLFEAVVSAELIGTVEEVPITPEDLPGYAVALFDRYLDRPHLLRLAIWHRLEGGADSDLPALRAADEAKAAAIAEAQRRGRVSARIPAEELRGIVLALSLAGVFAAPGLDPGQLPAAQLSRMRHAVAEAVRAATAVGRG